MRLIGCLFTAACLVVGPAWGEPVRVRSGEHPTFSRLVIELPTREAWRFGRIEDGYALELTGEGREMDLSGVFRMIPRDRIAGLRQSADLKRLEISVTCECHATAVDFRDGWIIIDVIDGSAPADSAFETVLAKAAATVESPGSETSAGSPFDPDRAEDTRIRTERTSVTRAWQRNPDAFLDAAVPPMGGAPRDVPVLSKADSDHALPEEPALPDRHDETLLLEELARAASQGLLEVDVALPEEPSLVAEGPIRDEPPSDSREDDVDNQRLRVQTSIDRDTGVGRQSQSASGDGIVCLPDSLFRVEDWAREGDPGEILSELRQGLLGEFDSPDTRSVAELAQYYLYLGFGAEARSTILELAPNTAQGSVLLAIASILDGDSQSLPGPLARQSDCPGRVAFWSMLAEGGPKSGMPVDSRAIRTAFSALPLHLRRHLGPTLAERFLAVGDEESAFAIRDAISRAPGDHGASFELLEIGLSDAAGDQSALLTEIAAKDDSVAASAVSKMLEAGLASGDVPEGASDLAAAMAVEVGSTDQGQELAELAVRALLSNGDFHAALHEIEVQRNAGRLDLSRAYDWFAEALAAGAPDGVFADLVFRTEDALRTANLPEKTATAVAARLLSLGFFDSALDFVTEDMSSEAARLVRADALIRADRAAEAIAHLEGLGGTSASRLRGAAFLAIGDHAAAAEEFGAAGDARASARAAWFDENWDAVEQSGDAIWAERVPPSVVQEPGASGEPSVETGSDAADMVRFQARSLVADAEAIRAFAQRLLDSGKGDPSRP